MKNLIVILMCLGLTQNLFAQNPQVQIATDTCAYSWEQNEVVFRFDPNTYMDMNTSYGMWRKLHGVKIRNVYVSGEFNNWATQSKDFIMEKQGEIYVFRMQVEPKGGLKMLQFKFVINGKYWVEPKASCANVIDSGAGWGSKNYILYLK